MSNKSEFVKTAEFINVTVKYFFKLFLGRESVTLPTEKECCPETAIINLEKIYHKEGA